jgi:polyhydroxyalkanoate synthesis regulator phasin
MLLLRNSRGRLSACWQEPLAKGPRQLASAPGFGDTAVVCVRLLPELFLRGALMTEDKKSLVQEMISTLKQQRDELALQIHLGKKETKELWDKLDDKWDKLTRDYDPVKDAVSDVAEGVWSGLELIAGELKTGFDRVRKSLQDEQEDKP